MSLFKSLFGAGEAAGPSADEVVAAAINDLKRFGPQLAVERKGQTALSVVSGTRGSLWNLADLIRLAPRDPAWRAGISSLAQQVVTGLASAPEPDEVSEKSLAIGPKNVVVLVWPQAKLEAVGFDVVHEPLVPGLVFFYGVRGGGKISSIRPDRLAAMGMDLATLRESALKNMALSPDELQIGPLDKGVPVLTNHAGYGAASSLLADTAFWKQSVEKLGPVLVAVPAPSRVFFAPDQPPLARALGGLLEHSLKMEEEILSAQLLRFDGQQWSLANPAH